MRKTLFLLLLTPLMSYGQSFYFNDTSTTLIKTTNQTPAHWYLEIFSNELVDTTLRWKTSFDNIPPQWDITFDDGDNDYPVIYDGDSADFTLFTGLSFPQKLIIGAHLNGTAGEGSVFFDIYDPEDPSYVVTIEYHFIVGYLTIESLSEAGIDIQRNETGLKINSGENRIHVSIHSLEGKLLYNEQFSEERIIDLTKVSGQQVIVSLQYNNSLYAERIPVGL